MAPDLLWHFFPAEPSWWERTVCSQEQQKGQRALGTRLERMHGHDFLTGCFKGSPELFDQVLQTLFTALLFAALAVAFITGYFIWARAERTLGFESTQCIYK